MGVALSLGGKYFPVAPGAYVVGRDAACQFAIDHPSVSRRHAMLTVRPNGATIEDLGSRNGVTVDDAQVTGQCNLKDGSRIRIGNQEIRVRMNAEPESSSRERAETPLCVGPDASRGYGQRFQVETIAREPPSVGSNLSDFFKHVERADLALAEGDAIEAEAILGRQLTEVVASLRAGIRVDGRIPRVASTHAMRLAQTRRSPYWINYLFELYTLLEVLMPREVVDGLHKLAGMVKPIDVRAIDKYVATLSQCESDLDAQERGLLRRIALLKDLAAGPRSAGPPSK